MRVLTFLLVLSLTDSFSQLPFRKAFVGDVDVYSSGVNEALDGGLILLGTTSHWQGNSDILLVKTDVNGDTIWTRTFGGADDERASHLVIQPDSGYSVFGMIGEGDWGTGDLDSTGYFIRVDRVGVVQWSRAIQPLIDIQDVAPSAEGGYLLCGSIANPSPMYYDGTYLLKMDSLGSIIWSRSFAIPYCSLLPRSSVTTDDGGYLISGCIIHSGSPQDNGILIRTDADGNLVWSNAFRSTHTAGDYKLHFNNAIPSASGGFLVSGSYFLDYSSSCVFLARVDMNGDLVWSKAYRHPVIAANGGGGGSMLELANGDIIIGGTVGLIIRTDPDGTLLESTFYDGFNALQIDTSMYGGFLLLGEMAAFNVQISIARSDSAGSIDCAMEDYPMLELNSTAEPFNEVVIAQAPTIIASDTTVEQGWFIGTMIACASVGIPTKDLEKPGIWVANPIGNDIIISGTRNGGSVGIFSLSGKELQATGSRNYATRMNTADLLPGLYVIRYCNEDDLEVLRVIKAPE